MTTDATSRITTDAWRALCLTCDHVHTGHDLASMLVWARYHEDTRHPVVSSLIVIEPND